MSNVVEQLPPPVRRLIDLALFERLSQSEIAQRCRMSLDMVGTEIRFGFALLRRQIHRTCD